MAEKKQGMNVVLRLAEPLEKGRNITCDNFFTSAELAHELMKKRFTLLGTLRMNRKETPAKCKPHIDRQLLSTKFMFSKHGMIASYVQKKQSSKCVF